MKAEKALAILFIIGVSLKLLFWPWVNSWVGYLIAFSLLSIAIMYFPLAFYFYSDGNIKRQNIALSIIAGFLLSIIPLGILCKVMYWPGSQTLPMIGSVLGVVLLLVTPAFKSSAPEELNTYHKNMLLRTGVLTVFSLLFYVTPTETLAKIQYKHDPELARVKALYLSDVLNEEYKKQHDQYMLKLDSLKAVSKAQENK
jgi:hypothetical protein